MLYLFSEISEIKYLPQKAQMDTQKTQIGFCFFDIFCKDGSSKKILRKSALYLFSEISGTKYIPLKAKMDAQKMQMGFCFLNN